MKGIKGLDYQEIVTPLFHTNLRFDRVRFRMAKLHYRYYQQQENKTTIYSTLTAMYMVVPPRLMRNRTEDPFLTDAKRF